MALTFTTAELALLQSGSFKARLFTTWFLDAGTFYFCDDVEDQTDGVNTYVGASALLSCTDIKSGSGFSAEPITLVVDGTRILASGFPDPAQLFRDILSYKLHQRRVNFSLALAEINSPTYTLIRTIYAGKINNARLVYPKMQTPIETGQATPPTPGTLEITIDSLAARYSRVTGRTRSHNDQLELDATDLFYQYTQDTVLNTTIYWGKTNPITGANGLASGNNAYNGGQSYWGIVANLPFMRSY